MKCPTRFNSTTSRLVATRPWDAALEPKHPHPALSHGERVSRQGLAYQRRVERRYAGRGDVLAVEFGDVAAIAYHSHAATQVGLKIHVRRGRDERQNLTAVVDQRELRRRADAKQPAARCPPRRRDRREPRPCRRRAAV